MSLENLANIATAASRRESSWDRTGGNADCLVDIAPGTAATLLDTAGPGKITHIWMTFREYPGHDTVLRDMVLRIWWDGAAAPSVEVPLGDFFGLGHALSPTFCYKRNFTLTSEPICVGLNERSLNCYWPMPFRRAARIELFNNGERSLRQLYFHVDYELGPQPPEAGLFHATFHQENELRSQGWINIEGKDNYTLLETEGKGHYAGCLLYVDNRSQGWFGEGDDMIFIDHSPLPVINGTGTEDYFNNAWCYYQPFAYPYYGLPLLEKRADGGAFYTMYRFHVQDPIRFATHIRVTMEHVWGEAIEDLAGAKHTNGFASVAFWYQDAPAAARPLPRGSANWPRRYAGIEGDAPADPLNLPAMEVALRARGLKVRTVFWLGQEWLRSGGGIAVETNGAAVEMPLQAPAAGRYRVEVQPINQLIDKVLTVGIKGGAAVAIPRLDLRRECDVPFTQVGMAHLAPDAPLVLVCGGLREIGIQQIKLTKLD
ncbi:MAG: DUF2961 domain-containing protein [Hyphomicrobiales bacterium]|nr:MAG: DUF2961 domain-containing protein [Hyphomicrobiales bacterium]